ncbi:hypothetical protein [Amedibacterium intestinale]|uniref:hypothetical protein n=1 Tax=Amedibacterium intestinale TaxID=2583452 RepID=UPI000E4B6375|nr:hypothetical protein [Amedibacterium intestinale]RHO21519.1 hypothetical protein DW220_06805 [Eubacterium sp. AM18-26]RHO25683.1 hypothetical protein DW212_06975 [Eubacterium sp. AM18-10LB-B]RHO28127.1 hypothetical protein DW208_09755 [Erysipelotrichaceae bacterium AM17-60]
MLKSIEKMLIAFETNNIIYCHWKSNEHLEEALLGDTDLDILFLPEQRNKLDIILNECGLKRFRSLPLMQYNAIEDYIGFDKDTAKIWHLHLHYQMTLGEKHLKGYTITPWNSYILEHRQLDKLGIYTSSCEIELVLLIVRIALKKRMRDFGKKIGKDDLIEFVWLSNRVNFDLLLKFAKDMLDEQAAKEILEISKNGLRNKNQLSKLQRILRKDLKLFTGYSRISSRYMRTKREIFWLLGGVKRRLGIESVKANRRISPSGGCVVALLGCDGAGKSTTLAYVKKEFQKKLDVVTVYFGSGDGSSSLLRKPMKLVAKRVGGKGLGHTVEKEYENKDKISLKAKMYSFAKVLWAITLAQEKKAKLKKMTKARNASMLVLTDRYPQTEISGFSDGPLLTKYSTNTKGLMKKISEWEYNIYKSAYVNPPDLVIKLMVPTEIAISRKPEMTVDEIENKKRVVMAMNASRHSVIIDTSREMTKSFSDVMEEIWKII